MHRLLLRCAVVLALVIVPSLARADDRAPEGAWYGYQTLLLDGAAVALFAGAAASDGFALGAAGGGATFVAGAPTVHLLHHNPRAAGKSLALRLLLPLGGGVSGGLVGAATYEPPPPAETSAARRLPAVSMPVPVFSVSKGNTSFGLSASF